MDATRRRELLEASHLGRAVARKAPATFDAGDAGGPLAQQLRVALAPGASVDQLQVIAAGVAGALKPFLSPTPNWSPAGPKTQAQAQADAAAAAALKAILSDALTVLDEVAG